MCEKYSLTKFANFLIIVLRTEIATTFKAEAHLWFAQTISVSTW